MPAGDFDGGGVLRALLGRSTVFEPPALLRGHPGAPFTNRRNAWNSRRGVADRGRPRRREPSWRARRTDVVPTRCIDLLCTPRAKSPRSRPARSLKSDRHNAAPSPDDTRYKACPGVGLEFHVLDRRCPQPVEAGVPPVTDVRVPLQRGSPVWPQDRRRAEIRTDQPVTLRQPSPAVGSLGTRSGRTPPRLEPEKRIQV